MPKKIGSSPVLPPSARTPAAPIEKRGAQPTKASSWAPPQKSYDAASATLEQLRRSLPAQAFDLKSPATRAAGAFTTGLGAPCQLKLDAFQPQMTPSGYVMPYKMTVVYEDKSGYFGGAKQVNAWSQLKGTDGAVAATLDQLTLERQPDGKYVGTAFITQKAAGSAGLKEAALAFGSGGRWDSNQGQNYHLPL